ncbi:MAG: ribosome-associated translation inhibitor RaiA [Dokdonella sp.]
MQINVKGHHIEVTQAMREHALSKFDKLTHAFDNARELNIVLSVEKLMHKAEATMLLAGTTLHADASSTDMYAAMDALADKLTTQVRKHQDKLHDHHADAVRAQRFS